MNCVSKALAFCPSKNRPAVMAEGADSPANWSVDVEELVDRDDVDGAITLLESVVAALERCPSGSATSPAPDLRLAYALTDLAGLYRARGFSSKSDELESRALVVKLRSTSSDAITPADSSLGCSRTGKEGHVDEELVAESKAAISADEDDWESIADRELKDPTPLKEIGQLVELSLKDSKPEVLKRRGRGSFLFEKNSLYSDQIMDNSTSDAFDDHPECETSKGSYHTDYSLYGTSHVLVLFDFPPSTRTSELEKLFSSYTEQGVVIRWVNDTTALAVFGKASTAQDAQSKLSFPFNVRILNDNDYLLSSLSDRDLEPPHPRPKTSARTAKRLIAHGMGRKLPSDFGAKELKKQEEDRRNRIHKRQALKDEAWGPEGP